MTTYDGISSEGMHLLAQNRLEDSKEFYDAHKAQIKAMVLTPLAQITEALTPDFMKIDPQMYLIPTRIISRIRRDTRFSKEKHLYREHVWITFARHKERSTRETKPLPWPCMWFEAKADEGSWSAGVCIFAMYPAYMQFFRQQLLKNPKEFLEAAEAAQKAGAVLRTVAYKKDRYPDAPEHLKPYLNAKEFFFEFTSHELALLGDERIIAQLRSIYTGYGPLYRWLLRCAETFLSE